MIISEPAAIIISETLGQGFATLGRLRFKGRERRATNPLTSQAYADAALLPVTNRPGTAAAPRPSAIQRRGTPLR